MKTNRLKRLIVLLLALAMLITGSGFTVLAESAAGGDDAAVPEAVTVEDEQQGSEDADVDAAEPEQEAEEPAQTKENIEDQQSPESDEPSSGTESKDRAPIPGKLPSDAREAAKAVAESQIGEEGNYYKEFTKADSESWDASFALFVLNYSKILDIKKASDIHFDCDTTEWVKALEKNNLLKKIAEATDESPAVMPEIGDIVFIGKDSGNGDAEAGIVFGVDSSSLTIIGADRDNNKKVEKFDVNLGGVLGFVSLKDIAPNKIDAEEPAGEDAEAAEEASEDGEEADEDADAEQEEEAVVEEETPAPEEDADGRELGNVNNEAEIVAEPGFGGKIKSLFTSDKSRKISVTGYMPEDATVKAYPVSVSIPGVKVLTAYDITIYVKDEDGKEIEWQPVIPLNVSIEDSKLAKAEGRVSVFHMEDKNADAEHIADATVDEGGVQFEAESFSIYAVTEETEDPRVNYRFWLDKNDIGQSGKEPYAVISLEDGEKLLAPAAPQDQSRGKFLGNKYDEDDSDVTYPVTASVPDGATADVNIDIYAVFDGTQYATFMSLPLSGKRTVFDNAVMTKDGDTYSVSDLPTYGGPNGYKFLGWTLTEPSDVNGYGTAIPEGDYYPAGSTITGQTGAITLYPVCKKMYNLTFDGNGGLVNELPLYKVLVTEDDDWADVLAKLNTVERSGHNKNNGWFDGPDEGASPVATTGDIDITADTTYYAHWTPTTTTVTVKYWKEPVDRTPSHHVPYELIDSETITVPTGTVLTLDASSMTIGNCTLKAETVRGNIASGGAKVNGGTFTKDTEMNYFYTDAITAFDANGGYHATDGTAGTDMSVAVAEDGSTIIDVWYNRTVYNVRFTFRAHAFASGCYTYRYSGLPHASVDRTSQYYQIRLGESLDGIWPDLTASDLDLSILNFGYKIVSIGQYVASSSQATYPDAVSALFDTPLSYVTEELLDCSNSSNNIDLWGRFNNINFRGGLTTATVTENFETASGGNTSHSATYNYGKGDNSNPPVPYNTAKYPGYTLDVQRTISANGGTSYVTDNQDGTVSIHYKQNGSYNGNVYNNYKANVYYKLDTYTIRLNYGNTTLVSDNNIKYTQPIQSYLQGNSSTSAIFADPTEAARAQGLPDYMVFGGWYTDEDCNEDYKLTDTTIMPASNAILYAKFTPKGVNVSIDNGKTDADQTKTNPNLNMSGSEFGGSVRYLKYQNPDNPDETHPIKYYAHEHTVAEFMPTYWTAPVWENHVFTGWQIRHKNDDGSWSAWEALGDFNAIVDHDIEIRGNWQDLERHSIHYIENEKEVYLDTNTYVIGTTIVIKGSDTEIYDRESETSQVFRYWTLDGGDDTKYYPGDTITMGDSDIRLIGHFETGGTSSGSQKATYTFMVPSNGNWETYYEEIVYKSERLSPPPTDPEISGKTFRGWYTDETLKHKFNGFGNVNAPKDTVIYANFTDAHQVTYLGVNGETITVQSYDHGEYLNTTGVGGTYSHNGQTPTGWYPLQLTPGDETGDPNPNYKYGYNGATEISINADWTLYPVFEPAYTLTFDTQGGTSIPAKVYGASQNLNFTWPEPDDVIREDYTFTGKWYTDAACTQEFNWNTCLTEDTTIYAEWVLNPGVTLETQYTIAWWVEKSDSTGDRNDLTNYFYSNSEVVTGANVGDLIGKETQATANVTGAASLVSHVDTAYIPAADRGYFEYYNAKVSYSKGLEDTASVITLDGDATAPVDKSGKTTLNIFISRVRYNIKYVLNGNGEIRFNNTDYATDWTQTGWLGMPFAGKWPLEDNDGISSPKLTMSEGLVYQQWSNTEVGARTTPVQLDREWAHSAVDGTITFTLNASNTQSYTTYINYRFRENESDTYKQVDYRGYNYDQVITTAIDGAMSAKEITDYSRDTADFEYENNVTFTLKSAYQYSGNQPYIGRNTSANRVHFVTDTDGDGNHKVKILYANGSEYTGTDDVYFRTSSGWTPVQAAVVRLGHSQLFDATGTYTYTFKYTRNTHHIILHDSRTDAVVSQISVMSGESIAGKVNDTDPCSAYNMTPDSGKEFEAWSRSANSVIAIRFSGDNATTETMPDNDLHLYAHWRVIQVTVTVLSYDNDPAKTRTETRDIYTQFKYFGIMPEEIPGKAFVGWRIKDTNTMMRNGDAVTSDIIIEPVYDDLRADAVTYDLNGGTVDDAAETVIDGCDLYGDAPAGRIQYKDTQDYVAGGSAPVKALNTANITIPSGTRKFAYWCTDKNGEGTIYYPGDVIELPAKPATTVLYAIYVQDLTTTIIYDLNYTGAPDENTSTDPNADADEYKKKVEFVDYIGKDDSELIVNDEYIVGTELDDSTNKFVTMKYEVGTGSPAQQVRTGAVRPGYTFLGWDERETLPAGETPKYQEGDTIRAVSYDEEGNFKPEHRLYAHWKKDEFPVKVYPIEMGNIGDEDTNYAGVYDVADTTLPSDTPAAFKTLRTDATGQFWSAYLTSINKTAFPANTLYAYATAGDTKIAELQYVAIKDGDDIVGYKWQYKPVGGTWTDFVMSGDSKTDIKLYYLKPTELPVKYLLKDGEGNLTEIDPEEWSDIPAADATTGRKTTVSANQDTVNSYGTTAGGTLVFAKTLTNADDSTLKLHYVGTGAGPTAVSNLTGVDLSENFYLQNSDDGILNAGATADLAESTPKTEAFAVYVVYEEQPAYLKIENASEEDVRDYTFRLTIGGGTYTGDLRTASGTISVASGQTYYDIPINNGENEAVYIPYGSGLTYQVQLVKDGAVVDPAVESVKWGDEGNSGTLVTGPLLKTSDAWSFPTESTKFKLVELKDLGMQALTVTNTIEGEYADMTKRFNVTITLTKSDPTATISSAELPEVDSPAGGTENPAFTLSADGKSAVMTVSLGHNESVNIPAISTGWKYTVTEGDHDGYEVTYKTGDGEWGAIEPTGSLSSSDVTVTLKNEFQDDTVVPSGIETTKSVLMPMFLAMLLALGVVLSIRRRVCLKGKR